MTNVDIYYYTKIHGTPPAEADFRRFFRVRPPVVAVYFATTRRIGQAAHVATDEQYQTMRDAGAFDDDVIRGAADAVLFERARVLLLGGATPDTIP
jgi:hypothetical protein